MVELLLVTRGYQNVCAWVVKCFGLLFDEKHKYFNNKTGVHSCLKIHMLLKSIITVPRQHMWDCPCENIYFQQVDWENAKSKDWDTCKFIVFTCEGHVTFITTYWWDNIILVSLGVSVVVTCHHRIIYDWKTVFSLIYSASTE